MTSMVKRRVVMSGVTGFIGRHLSKRLVDNGYEVAGLTRNPEKAGARVHPEVKLLQWDGGYNDDLQRTVDGAWAVINLAGENIAGGIWTEAFKRRLVDSRLNVANALVTAICNAGQKPLVFVQASAIGYYGSRGDEVLVESSGPGKGFLAELVDQWEASIQALEPVPVRRIYTRIGIVLGEGEGTLAKLQLPFKMFVGGSPGSGRQWFSWVHIEDVVGSIRFLMENERLSGAFNLAAPNPTRMKAFCEAYAHSINRPSWMPVPEFMLKITMGAMAEEMILASQRVLPKRLQDAGYSFMYPQLVEALGNLADIRAI